MANKKRLIDANLLSDLLDVELKRKMKLVSQGEIHLDNLAEGIMTVAILLGTMPTVNAVEVVHGRWEQVQRWATKAKYRCSVCGREITSAVKVNIEKYPYCHCGAEMDGDFCSRGEHKHIPHGDSK